MEPIVKLVTYVVSTLVLRNGLGLVNRRIEALSARRRASIRLRMARNDLSRRAVFGGLMDVPVFAGKHVAPAVPPDVSSLEAFQGCSSATVHKGSTVLVPLH